MVFIRERAISASAIAAAIAISGGSTALAAGPGYGGGGGSSSGVPAGFSSITAAKTFENKGGTLKAKNLTVSVPAGDGNHLQVVLTSGPAQKLLDKPLKKDKLVLSFGVVLKRGSAYTKASKQLTVTVTSKHIKAGDILAIYDPSKKTFVKAHGTIVNGKVVVRLTKGEAIAVLEAPGHSR